MTDAKLLKHLRERFTLDDEGFLVRRFSNRRYPAGSRVEGTVSTRGYRKTIIHPNRAQYYYHRLVFLFVHGYMPDEVDHIDRNGINNRPDNLRAADNSINNRNRGGMKGSSSAFLGVSRSSDRKKWIAQISGTRGKKFLGTFATEEEAARAYDRACIEREVKGANLNFPLKDYLV